MTQERQPTEREILMARKLYKMQEFGTLVKMFRATVQDSFAIRPMNRVKMRIAELAPQRNLDGAQVPEGQPKADFGFGFIEKMRRFRVMQPQPQNPEDATAQAEHKQQLVEAAEARKLREAEAQRKKDEAAELERIRTDDFSGVQVSG